MMSAKDRDTESRLLVYGNVLIEDEIRLELFKLTFPAWVAFWEAPILLRIRGSYAGEASNFANQFGNVEIRLNAEFLQWRFQSLVDLCSVNSKYVVFYLEDHLMLAEKNSANFLLDELDLQSNDILQYSWFDQYAKFRHWTLSERYEKRQFGTYLSVDRNMLNRIPGSSKVYFCSLSSIFRRTFILKILYSGRPWIRKYDPKSPFDVEQQAGATWFLPINFGVTNFEISACIDDDHGVEGYSLISRGFVSDMSMARGTTHHPRFSLYRIFTRLGKFQSNNKGMVIISTKFKPMALIFLRYISIVHYSIYARILRTTDHLRYFKQSGKGPKTLRPKS
jgi:hypothetical protein